MTDSSAQLHEDRAQMSDTTVERHRAVVSLMEELEAIDWYDQRIDATGDESLAAVLIHNRDEEKEHAAMVIEWLRRNDAEFAEELRTYLFTSGPILDAVANEGESGSERMSDVDGRLHVGDLRNEESL